MKKNDDIQGCQNPFFDEKNHSEGIKVFVVVNGEKLRICEKCWIEMCENEKYNSIEWGDTVKQVLDIEAEADING